MSHELTVREDGKVEFAFAGSRNAIWHGLGSELADDASVDVWIKDSGLDWNIVEVPLLFDAGVDFPNPKTYPKKKALIRSDSRDPLSIVSEGYKVVQPREVLEFFRELTEIHGFKLSAAGSIFGGTRFWATAEVGLHSFVKNEKDTINGYLLLVTSADGTLATTAKLTSTRTVCNNTMQIALRGEADARVTHRTVFDPKKMQIDLGIINQSWDHYLQDLNKLAETPMTGEQVHQFFKEFEFGDEYDEEVRSMRNRIQELSVLYEFGPGSSMVKGTAYGALNALTHYYTFGPQGNRRSKSSNFWNSYLGEGAKKKNDAMELLLA